MIKIISKYYTIRDYNLRPLWNEGEFTGYIKFETDNGVVEDYGDIHWADYLQYGIIIYNDQDNLENYKLYTKNGVIKLTNLLFNF